MKEIDIIKHAQTYMDMLSKRTNPITKEKYSDSSDLNNERLLKCFDFVSEILLKVIAEEEQKEELSKKEKESSSAAKAETPTETPEESDTQFVNTLVSDDVEGEDVVKLLISKGVLNHGFHKNDKKQP